MALEWVPTFLVGERTFVLNYPVTRWVPGQRTVGRTRKSAIGGPGTTVQLKRYTLGMTLRFTEDEWTTVRDFVKLAQFGDPFIWMTGAAQPESPASFIVVWESPRIADGIRPTRDGTMLWMMTLPIVLGMDEVFDVKYFTNDVAGSL